MRRALIALALLVAACSSGASAEFLRAKAAGDRAQSAGRWSEAAAAYEQAAARAARPRDRDEAVFLAAATFQRGHDLARAEQLYGRLLREAPAGERTPRAALELAWIAIERGDADGWAKLEAAVRAHPGAGPSRRALEALLTHLDEAAGAAASLAWIDGARPALDASELGETLAYQRAKRLESLGRVAEARDAYAGCAEQHPYPFGALFDDALWNASLLDEKLGRPRDAVADLERMLRVREPSTLNGSYERPRFGAARLRMAHLWRDALGDREAARRELRTLWTDHPTSPLRDDALWEEVLLLRETGRATLACDRLDELARSMPDSRYLRCTHELCAGTPAPDGGRGCPPYLEEQIRTGKTTAPDAESAGR